MEVTNLRTHPALALTRSPLLLVLCQARIAAVRNIEAYIPRIQDELRRRGFPIDVSHQVAKLRLAEGKPDLKTRPQWEFRDHEEKWSIIVGEQAIVLQTTDYPSFEDFADRLALAAKTVSEIAGDLVLERVGLRYVDLIQPRSEESWREYLQEGLHGARGSFFEDGAPLTFAQTLVQTSQERRLIVRVAQNRDGMLLPPDLASSSPKLRLEVQPGELITLLDLDHFHEQRTRFDVSTLLSRSWILHDGLDRAFRETVTAHALKAWT